MENMKVELTSNKYKYVAQKFDTTIKISKMLFFTWLSVHISKKFLVFGDD